MDSLMDHGYSRKWHQNPKYFVAEPTRFYDCTTKKESYVVGEDCRRCLQWEVEEDIDTSDWNGADVLDANQSDFCYYAPFITVWSQLFEKLHLEEPSDEWRDQLDFPYFRGKPGSSYIADLLNTFDSLRLQFCSLREASHSAYLQSITQIADAIITSCDALGWNTVLITEGHFLTISSLPSRNLALYFDALRHLRSLSSEYERVVETVLISPLLKRRLVGVPITRRGWPLADPSCVVELLRSRIESVSDAEANDLYEFDTALRVQMSEMDNFRRSLAQNEAESGSTKKRGGSCLIFLSVGVLYTPGSTGSMSDEDVQRIAFFGKRLKAIGRVMHLCVPDAPLAEMVNLVVEKVRTLKSRDTRRDDQSASVAAATETSASTSGEPAAQKRRTTVVLLGWELGALLACYASLFEKIDGIVCIGLPIATINRTRIHCNDLLALISSPLLLAVGANSKTCPVSELERFRESVVSRSRAFVFREATDYLRVADTFDEDFGSTRARGLVSQTSIDAKLLLELCCFLKDVVLPNALLKATKTPSYCPSVNHSPEASKPQRSEKAQLASLSESQLTKKRKSCGTEEQRRRRLRELETLIEHSVRKNCDESEFSKPELADADDNHGSIGESCSSAQTKKKMKRRRKKWSLAGRPVGSKKSAGRKMGRKSREAAKIARPDDSFGASFASAAAVYSSVSEDALEKAAVAVFRDEEAAEAEFPAGVFLAASPNVERTTLSISTTSPSWMNRLSPASAERYVKSANSSNPETPTL